LTTIFSGGLRPRQNKFTVVLESQKVENRFLSVSTKEWSEDGGGY